MWTTRDFTQISGLSVVDVSQEGQIIILEGAGLLEEGDAILFPDSSCTVGVRYWDLDADGDQIPSPHAHYRIRSVEPSEEGSSWIACAEHFPRVIVDTLPLEM